jgi:hypothetical protein
METKDIATIGVQPRIPKIKSFLALFDILGFKDLIRNDQLDHVYRVFLGVKDIKDNTKEMTEHLQALLEPGVVTVVNYSDSFLIYSLDINSIEQRRIDKAFHALLAACDSLFIAANENGLPLRGSITAGDIIVSDNVVIGKPVVEAYEMEQQQEWIGCWVSKNALDLLSKEALEEDIKERAIVEYKIPLKKGNVEKMFAYNWTASCPFRKGNYTILNKRDRIDWAVERKHRNTWEFINQLKSSI